MPDSTKVSLLDQIGLSDGLSRGAVGLLVLALAASVGSIEDASAILAASKAIVVDRFDFVFIALANLAIIVVVLAGLHPAGARRLGTEDERPEFSRGAWIAMLFSAGLASGILYWAAAEPILHMQSNPLLSANPEPGEASRLAMQITVMHWGIHGWAIYVVVALVLGIQSYRHGQPLRFRIVLLPILGETWTHRWPGRSVDLLALFGTICGVATSIGLSAASMNATLSSLFPMSVSTFNQVVIIASVSVLGIFSALSGVDSGIRRLSSLNAWVSFGLALAFLVLGPTAEVLSLIGRTFVDYVVEVIPLGLYRGATPEARSWQGDWTVFYWAWWLAWAPFVSLFIARISRGRTIREFVVTVMFLPTAITLVWMAIFGGTAIVQEQLIPGSISDAVNIDYSLGIVAVIQGLGYPGLVLPLLAVASFLLFTWLITSLDSATLVMCQLLGVEKNRAATVFWGMALAVVAALLLVAGGLQALQAASIVVGLPLAFVVAVLALGLVRDLLASRV